MASINYLGTIDIGKVNAFELNKAAGITPVSFPGQDSGATQGVDTLGVIAYYNVSGVLTGEFNTLMGAIYDIQKIIDGLQTSSRTLYSPFISARSYNGVSYSRRQGTISINTSTSSSKLIDSGALFQTRGVQAGDYVKNMNTGVVTTVVSVDSETQLTLTADIFTASGVMYAVTVNIEVKVLSFVPRITPPGLGFIPYDLSVMQVKN